MSDQYRHWPVAVEVSRCHTESVRVLSNLGDIVQSSVCQFLEERVKLMMGICRISLLAGRNRLSSHELRSDKCHLSELSLQEMWSTSEK